MREPLDEVSAIVDIRRRNWPLNLCEDHTSDIGTKKNISSLQNL